MKTNNVLDINQLITEEITKEQLEAILKYSQTLNERIKEFEKYKSNDTRESCTSYSDVF